MGCKLIAFDLDGTFLDDDKNIPEENLKAIIKAHEAGIQIVPATGRIYKGVPQIIKELPFIRYYILINGGQVYDALEDRYIYKAEIPAGLAVEFVEYMDTLPVLYDCYQDDFGYMSKDMYDRAQEYVQEAGILQLIKSLRTPVPDLKETLIERARPVQKLQMYFNMENMDERARQLEILPSLYRELIFSTSVKTNIEVNSVNAGKDKALIALCGELNIDIKDTLAFGDGTNDTDMLVAAGIGVAMENALQEVKDKADYITSRNNAAGVAAGIEKFAFSEEDK